MLRQLQKITATETRDPKLKEALIQQMREKNPQISHKLPQIPQSNTTPHETGTNHHETGTNLVRSDLIKETWMNEGSTTLFLAETGVRGPQ